MAWQSALKMPRPTKFLHFMSLRTGTYLILLTHLINKITAFYGILAIFTSYPLSGLQLSMYIYSLPVLVFTAFLAGPVRSQSPWHCLAFAYLYVLDSIVNAVYTVVFGVTWFVVLASDGGSAGDKAPGGKMMGGAGGFSPEYNVSQVEVIAKPKPGVAPAQVAVAIGNPEGAAGSQALAGVVLSSSSMMSIFIICAFWLLRMYAVFVVLAYARQVLRHHIQVSSLSTFNIYASGGKGADLADDPFAEGSPSGEGIKGKLGRAMVRVGRGYWLGRDSTHQPDNIVLRTFASSKLRKSEDAGIAERERRRRSGTGPPAPPAGLVAAP